MDNEKLLSVCISSYNKGPKCLDLIKKLFQLEDDRLSIVVCDDCSDDATWNLLKDINDSRFVLHKNLENLGACSNWYETINHGDAEYCLHILDRDYIDIEMIKSLIDYLEKNKVGGGYLGNFFYNERRPTVNGEIEVYTAGEDTASRLGGLPFHPTGFFVRREEWEKGGFREYFYNEDKFGIYPHSYVMCFVGKTSDVAIMAGTFHKCVFSNNERSEFYRGKKMELWWDPRVVLDTSKKTIAELIGAFENPNYRNRFVLNCFKHSLVRATIRNRQETMDVGQMIHYGQQAYAISAQRLLLINFWYTFEFILFLNKSIGGRSNLKEILRISRHNRKAILKLAGTSKSVRNTMEDNLRKNQEFYSVMYRWIKTKNSGQRIIEWFINKGFHSVAIYGMRELGELLYDELQGHDEICVKYCIDREMEGMYKGTPISKPGGDIDADVIVVTAIHYYSEIEADLMKRMNCRVVSLEDVLYG